MATTQCYPSDISDDDWASVCPCLCLMRQDAPQREHPLRALFNGLRYLAHTGCPWRYLLHGLPPWPAVYQQWERWRKPKYFDVLRTI
jgi:transposase